LSAHVTSIQLDRDGDFFVASHSKYVSPAPQFPRGVH
jgi:hypothetical protein